MRSYKQAFTLAEVLITLGIIGILAAVTIPNLIAATNTAKYRSQFKKAMSTLNQTSRMAQSNYDIDYGATNTKCTVATGDTEKADQVYTFCALFNSTLKAYSYLGLLSEHGYTVTNRSNAAAASILDSPAYAAEGGEETEGSAPRFDTDMSNYIGYTLADGSIVGFNKDAFGCALPRGEHLTAGWIADNPECVGFIDVNGITGPNTIINCDSVNSAVLDPSSVCNVPMDVNHTTDVFPIVFHDAAAEAATPAGKYILGTWKSTTITDNVGTNAGDDIINHTGGVGN